MYLFKHPIKYFKAKKNISTKEKYYEFVKSKYVRECEHLTKFPNYPISIKNLKMEDNFYLKKIISPEGLRQKYKVDQIAGSGDTFSKAINIMQWLTNNTFYCGISINYVDDITDKILKKSLGKKFNKAINCREKAIIFTDLLLSIGIHALPLLLYGFNTLEGKSFCPCHLMVHVYLNEQKKWAIFDPSFNAYFMENGKILNIIELRECLTMGKFPQLIGYSFNGSTTECLDCYKSSFVAGSIEFISTWKDGERQKKLFQKTFCNFNYMLEPENDSYVENSKSLMTNEQIKKFKDYNIYIGIKELLNVEE